MFVWGDWRVALVVLGCMPISAVLMSIAMAAMMPMDMGKQGKQDKDAKQNKSAGSIVGEVVLGIRTVASFNAELQFYEDYEAQVDIITSKGVPRAFTGGFVNGIGMGVMYVIFGIQIYYGCRPRGDSNPDTSTSPTPRRLLTPSVLRVGWAQTG